MAFDVASQVALVTGANRGIGKVITETLLNKGATKVYGAVRNPDSLANLVEKHGDKVVPLELDLSKNDTVVAAAKRASDTSLVINNAGVLKTASAFSEDAFESLQFEMDVNVYGLLRIARAFAPVLKANGGGAFVQLNSVVSMKCFPDLTTYCASKAAAYSLTQGLRESLEDQGTQVVSVHPGPINTDMGETAGFKDVAESPQLVADAILAALKDGSFHVFPDSMAKQIGSAYHSFAKNVVEAKLSEG